MYALMSLSLSPHPIPGSSDAQGDLGEEGTEPPHGQHGASENCPQTETHSLWAYSSSPSFPGPESQPGP